MRLLGMMVLICAPVTVAAQGARLSYIAQVSYGSDINKSGDGAVGIGGGIGFPLAKRDAGRGVRGVATFDWFFPKEVTLGSAVSTPTYWEFNINGVMDVPKGQGLYVGTGINYTTYSLDAVQFVNAGGTNLGLNLLGGFKAGRGVGAPFVQARLELGGGKQLVLSAGVEF